MKVLVSLVIVLLWLSSAKAQMQVERLDAVSLNNHKSIWIKSGPGLEEGLELKLAAIHKGEPAATPIYLSPSIKCPGEKDFKNIDLAAEIDKSVEIKLKNDQIMILDSIVGTGSKEFPSGQLHVCALDRVNFDNERIFISILPQSSSGCIEDQVIDLMFPLSNFCSK